MLGQLNVRLWSFVVRRDAHLRVCKGVLNGRVCPNAVRLWLDRRVAIPRPSNACAGFDPGVGWTFFDLNALHVRPLIILWPYACFHMAICCRATCIL